MNEVVRIQHLFTRTLLGAEAHFFLSERCSQLFIPTSYHSFGRSVPPCCVPFFQPLGTFLFVAATSILTLLFFGGVRNGLVLGVIPTPGRSSFSPQPEFLRAKSFRASFPPSPRGETTLPLLFVDVKILRPSFFPFSSECTTFTWIARSRHMSLLSYKTVRGPPPAVGRNPFRTVSIPQNVSVLFAPGPLTLFASPFF